MLWLGLIYSSTNPKGFQKIRRHSLKEHNFIFQVLVYHWIIGRGDSRPTETVLEKEVLYTPPYGSKESDW